MKITCRGAERDRGLSTLVDQPLTPEGLRESNWRITRTGDDGFCIWLAPTHATPNAHYVHYVEFTADELAQLVKAVAQSGP